MRAIILAQGEGSRWDDPIGIYSELKRHVPYKQWLPVGDRTMLARTVDLLREEGIENITVVAEPKFEPYISDADLWSQQTVGDLVDAVWQTSPFWHDRGTIYLHGDVLFSRLAVDLLCNPHSTKVLLARTEPSVLTGKKADEIFGFHIGPQVYTEVKARVLKYHRSSPPKPWVFPHLLWDLAEGHDYKAGLWQIKQIITEINDYTDDIDSPQGWDQFWGPMCASALMEDEQCSTS